jgi:hypothetical protein
MANQIVLHGARVYLSINGKRFGWGTDFRASVQVQLLPVDVLNRPEPAALLPVGYRIDAQIGYARILSEDPVVSQFLAPTDTEHTASFVNFPPFQVTVFAANTPDEKPILTIEDARVVSWTMQVQARSFVIQNLAIQGTILRHESEL